MTRTRIALVAIVAAATTLALALPALGQETSSTVTTASSTPTTEAGSSSTTGATTPGSGSTDTVVAGPTTVLPLLGAPLTIEIGFDATGGIASVVIDPSAGFTLDDDPDDDGHEVEFSFGDGTVELKIETENGEISTELEAGSIADISGPGSWTADVFGTGLAQVLYSVGSGDAGPTISIDAVTVPSGVTFAIGDLRVDDDGERTEIRVRFFSDGLQRTLKIRVDDEPEDGEAELKLTLSELQTGDDSGGFDDFDDSDDDFDDDSDDSDDSDDDSDDSDDDDSDDDDSDDDDSDDSDDDRSGSNSGSSDESDDD